MFEHCRYCVAPKRHPGCHDKCPDYEEDRKKYDAKKAEFDKKKKEQDEIYRQRENGIRRAIRGK
jgi:hypothetical protein